MRDSTTFMRDFFWDEIQEEDDRHISMVYPSDDHEAELRDRMAGKVR
jgi:hypothetical protein